MAGYVRQSSFSDGDTIAASLLNNEYDQLLAAFNVSSGHTHDGSTTGDGGPVSKLYSNALTFGTNAEADITVNFNAASNDGVLTWMEDEDYFKFSDDVLVNSTEKLYFRDTAIYLNSSADGQLDLVADTEIQIAATTVDINGNVDISGTLTIGSAGISEAELEILDGLTATTTELNIMDGSVTTQATVTLVATDGVVISDADVMKQALVSDFDTYISGTTATLTNKTLTSPVLNTAVSGSAILDEDNFASDSATKLATQQSIKAYIATQVSTGDITSVVAGSGLTGGATSGDATLNVIGGTGITANADDIAIDSTVATLTGSQTLTNKSIDLGANTLTGSLAEFNSALQSESFASLTGSETLTNKTLTSPVLNTGISGTAFLDEDDFASDSATKVASQQSIKAYIATQVSIGDITSVVAGAGLTGGATSGAATLNVVGGTGITANADDIAIDSTVTTLTGSQTLTNKTLTSPVLNTGVSGTAVKDEDNMSSDSATHLATQQSIKAYVDAQILTEDTLAELNDTNITSPGDAALLIYDTGTSTWRDYVVSGDVTISDAGVAAIGSGVVVNADINASAAIADSKLATISTAGKVDIGALEIDGASEMGAGLADADLFIVDDGAGGTEKSMLASRLPTYLFAKVSGDITVNSSGVGAIGSGVIVNADVNASAAIADSKLATISTADKVAGGAIQIDSGTDGTGITLANTDKLLVDDGGATKYVNASQITTFINSNANFASTDTATALAIALG
ncbi:hypothetical protein [uncultured Mediterranean phage]|nr:hypothetical protein [uncultured Mediterranean phage]